MTDIPTALKTLTPGAEWIVYGEEYSGIEWLDKTQTKPTELEIEQKIAELKYQKEVNVYQEKRKLEYPDWGDQLDKIYHDGIDAWKADIKAIKDKYPKQTMDATELQKRKDAAIFKLQKRNYEKAVARLAQPRLKLGTPYTESIWDASENKYVDQTKYKDVPVVDDPTVISDEAERDAAQAIIDATPQSVIDSINS